MPVKVALSVQGKCRARRYREEWRRHTAAWKACQRCPLGVRAMYRVLGDGTLPSDVLFLGEAPGKTEDVTGVPFSGQSGRLLRTWIALLQREVGAFDYFISNVVACRPCDDIGMPNRVPSPEEAAACSTRVTDLLRLIQPRGVVLLGRVAEQYFTGSMLVQEVYHPSYVLRQGGITSHASDVTYDKLKTFLRRIL